MSIDEFDSLSEEERLLAARLGLAKRAYAPSESVDNAVRAAARNAVTRPSRGPRPARFAWLAYGGAAAACVLALGVSWKMMRTPHPTQIDAMRPGSITTDAPVSDVVAPASPPRSAPANTPEAAAQDAPEVERAQVQPVPQDAPLTPARARAKITSEKAVTQPAAPMATGVETTSAEDKAAEVQAPQTQSLPSTAVPSPSVERSGAARRANEAAAVEPRPASNASDASASPQTAKQADVAPPPPAATSQGTVELENGYDPRPPKTTDAQDVQQEWLKRIRTLFQAGKKDEAAESLAAWRKRYPDAPVPPDLAPLGK